MCGITGWICWDKNLREYKRILAEMTDKLTHRGPDAKGFWTSNNAAIGHTRLIVIDPEGGQQPMVRHNSRGNFVITYNGELYNTNDIRDELKALGYKFKGHSDTEVVLISFIQWGPACVKKFNGIFAFGIWDETEKSLFLARDRLGVKPLFYAARNNSLLFASEIKALLAHPEIKAEIDSEGLAEIFALGPARTPGHGVFKNIYELKPGYCMTYNRSGMKINQYWSLASYPRQDDVKTTANKIHELLKDAVERQLISDVPVCTLLSGGLDSSALSAFAANHYKEHYSEPLDTFSVDYADNEIYFEPNDFQPTLDNPWIVLMSDFLKTRHHSVIINTSELVESLTEAMRARDLPGMADIDSSLYLFSREIKKKATVALSGECADEVFGGYPWLYRKDALSSSTFPWSLKLKERINILSKELIEHIAPEEYVKRRYREALDEVPRLESENQYEARIREISYLNLTRWMPTLLDRKDRMSMACGLEIRVPFCDHRLVEYAWNIPWKIKNYNNIEKGILRKALEGVLPKEILERRKSPYPKTHNPAYLSAVSTGLLEILNDRTSPLIPLINEKMLRTIIDSCQDFDIPWFGQLMKVPQLFSFLIQLDVWLREYGVSIM